MTAPVVEKTWEADPDGSGSVRIRPTAPGSEVADPTKDPMWGWKLEPSGEGYVRIPPHLLPPVPRKGTWCKIFGLTQATEKNDAIVEVESVQEDGNVVISVDGEEFMIRPVNLAPLLGSEKMIAAHKEVTLNVNGVNCDNCRKPLIAALCKIPGVDEGSVAVKTKSESGAHPNTLTVRSVADEAAIKEAIGMLDAGRNKFTIAA